MNFKGFGTEPPANGGGGRPPANSLLARQSSIYSLTFDELQNTMGGSLGKDFGSMNMDELLKNIWSAEEVQSMAAVGAAGIGAPSVSPAQIGGAPATPLQRQGSLTLPRTLSQKTVDEVWRSLSKDGNGGAITPAVPPRQQTLGEITLEEFLVRAGVVREDNNIENNSPQFNSNSKPQNGTALFSANNHNHNNNNLGMISGIMNSNLNPAPIQIRAANLPLNANGVRSSSNAHHNQHQHQQPQQIFPKQNPAVAFGGGAQLGSPRGVMGLGSPGNQISSDGVRSNGDTSSVSPVPFVFNNGLRGRKGGGAVEKVVERRQRRMIKNRESAARSRARKQAYTMELEAEVAKLKEENEELRKKQEHMIEMQKNQAKELMNAQKGGKKRCLRRTQTGPW